MTIHLTPSDVVCRGKYRLVRLLGEGGFARVWQAENTLTNRRVALKVVHGESAGPEVVERLRREAVVSSRVRHRNVIDVYDLEEEGGLWFLVMEYLSGETLREALDRQRLPADVACSLLGSVMQGLAVMHQNGVVHRDIKPDNIYLARQDDSSQLVAKLIDFGICKVTQPDESLPPVTRAGTQGMGTPAYISPEQYADSASVDARTDVYSLGVVLYECLTGRAPHDAPSQRDLMLKMLTSTPAPAHELCPGLSPQLSAVIERAMQRDVAERYQSIEALAEAIAPFAAVSAPRSEATLARRRTQPPPLPSARRRAALSRWSALGALALAQAAGIYWAVTSLEPGTPVAALFSPHGNVLASFVLPPTAAAPRGAGMVESRAARPSVPVAVTCEIPGTELYINGERVAAVVSGTPTQLQLPPGMYRFEARRDGEILASDMALVQPGSTFELHLRAPSAAPALAEPARHNPPAGPAVSMVSTARRSEPAPSGAPLSREQLSDGISAHLGALQRCYELALEEQGAEPPLEPATLELELGIAASGEVTLVRTGSPWLSLDACIDRHARTWTFPKAGRATQLRFPLVFRRATAAQLSAAQLSAVVARSKGMLQRCYTAASAGGVLRLDVDLEVQPSGDVSNVDIHGEDSEVGACIARTVRLWRFPSADGATRTRFPVLLLPGV